MLKVIRSLMANLNINGGNNVIAPNATTVEQHYHIVADSADVKMSSDEKTVRHLMRYMNVLLMDAYFDRGPARVDLRILSIHDACYEIITSSSFVLYDENLRSKVNRFFDSWNNLLLLGSKYYSASNNGQDVVFGEGHAEFDTFKDRDEEDCFDEIMGRWNAVADLFKAMMDCIKQKYVIDYGDVLIK